MRTSSIEFLCGAAERRSDAVGVRDEHGGLTFGELIARAARLGEILREDGAPPGPVVVHLPRSLPAVVAFAGVLASGGFYVPVDLRSPAERLKRILDRIRPRHIISSREDGTTLVELGVESVRTIFVEDVMEEPVVGGVSEHVAAVRRAVEGVIDTDPCYVMHTSGSTGTPKGVVVTHRGVIDYIDWADAALGVDATDVIGGQAPFFFDNSTLDIYLGWSTGATLHLIADHLFAFPAALVDHMEQAGISFVFFVPSVLVAIARMALLSPQSLPRLRTVVFAGEVMPTRHLAYWQDQRPDITYVNLYGPTEITVDCTYFFVDRRYGEDESLPIGYPCRNSGILILDERDEPAPPGEPGELCVRGSSIASGYWRDAEATRRAFVQNPTHQDFVDPVYRTGDIVVRDGSGLIHFLGRKDHQIKHMGHRIEPGEIEAALLRLAGIVRACVLYDTERQQIVACYDGEREMDLGTLRRELAALVPAYMLPRRVERLSPLPLNSSGKIDRTSLARAVLDQTGR